MVPFGFSDLSDIPIFHSSTIPLYSVSDASMPVDVPHSGSLPYKSSALAVL